MTKTLRVTSSSIDEIKVLSDEELDAVSGGAGGGNIFWVFVWMGAMKGIMDNR
jgi:bacteriocin-like protein